MSSKLLRKKPPAQHLRVLKELRKLYPETGSELHFRTPYELVVAVTLSAQCTDKKVNEVTPHLFSKYGDFASLSKAPLQSIEKIIRPINYYRTKAKNIRAMAAAVLKDFNGTIPHTHDQLISLPGVGRKTANVVLSELRIAPSIPVDTHVFRVSRRLGFAKGNTPEKVEKELEERFEASDWYNLHHWLIYHGRRVCKAQRPLCNECPLATFCPAFHTTLKGA